MQLAAVGETARKGKHRTEKLTANVGSGMKPSDRLEATIHAVVVSDLVAVGARLSPPGWLRSLGEGWAAVEDLNWVRALLQSAEAAAEAGRRALSRVDLVRVNDRLLSRAGGLLPLELRSLDAIHLATAAQLGTDLGEIVTYDERTAAAARFMGFKVSSPA